jgi:hypothetical protein
MSLRVVLDSGLANTCAGCGMFPVIAPWYGGGCNARRIWCPNPACPDKPKVEATTSTAALVKWNDLNDDGEQ